MTERSRNTRRLKSISCPFLLDLHISIITFNKKLNVWNPPLQFLPQALSAWEIRPAGQVTLCCSHKKLNRFPLLPVFNVSCGATHVHRNFYFLLKIFAFIVYCATCKANTYALKLQKSFRSIQFFVAIFFMSMRAVHLSLSLQHCVLVLPNPLSPLFYAPCTRFTHKSQGNVRISLALALVFSYLLFSVYACFWFPSIWPGFTHDNDQYQRKVNERLTQSATHLMHHLLDLLTHVELLCVSTSQQIIVCCKASFSLQLTLIITMVNCSHAQHMMTLKKV